MNPHTLRTRVLWFGLSLGVLASAGCQSSQKPAQPSATHAALSQRARQSHNSPSAQRIAERRAKAQHKPLPGTEAASALPAAGH